MSISVRSLGVVAVGILVVLAWLLWGSAFGPRPALAESLAPFSPERLVSTKEPVAIASEDTEMTGDRSDRFSLLLGDAEKVDDSTLSLIASRINGDATAEVPVNLDLRNMLVLVTSTPQWRADSNGDGELNESDIAEFSDLWSWADSKADFNGDGIVDPDDYAAFVEAFDTREQKHEEQQLHLGGSVRFWTNSDTPPGGSFTIQLDSGNGVVTVAEQVR